MNARPQMTQDDALAEARRRWGPSARVWCGGFSLAPCHVGVMVAGAHGAELHERGHGLCWERAFLSADNRERGFTAPRRRASRPPAPSLFEGGQG